MKLATLLDQKKSVLIDRWLQMLCDSYPAQTAIFLRKEKDRFDNPVGHHISQGLTHLFETLLREMDRDEVLAALDEVIRIRALQDFSPSQALAFIFLLKNVIRAELAKEIREHHLMEEVLDLESHIDGLALLGFDVYTQRREKLCEIRITEVKNRVSGFLRSKGMDFNSL